MVVPARRKGTDVKAGDRVMIRAELKAERALYDGPATVEVVSETIPSKLPFILVYLDKSKRTIWVKPSECTPLGENDGSA